MVNIALGAVEPQPGSNKPANPEAREKATVLKFLSSSDYLWLSALFSISWGWRTE